MKLHIVKILSSVLAFWFFTIGMSWGYGGTIGPTEYTGTPPVPTDYKNPLQNPGVPHHYHVTICNDGTWYGVWYPPEWKGNNGAVRGTPKGKNQHGYAKEEDGTGGGVQIMGNGKGGDNIEITLRKENGDTVYLMIHVIDCSHPLAPGATRGRVAAAIWGGHSRAYLQENKIKAVTQHQLLQETPGGKLESTRKFVPACSPAAYTTNVNCSMLVKSCEKVSPAEAKSMGRCLRDKGNNSASIICQLNKKCPVAHLLRVKETRNDCPRDGRQWDVDAQWTFECI